MSTIDATGLFSSRLCDVKSEGHPAPAIKGGIRELVLIPATFRSNAPMHTDIWQNGRLRTHAYRQLAKFSILVGDLDACLGTRDDAVVWI